MNWHTVQVGKTCFRTKMRDPRKDPDTPFLYVDISSIDRNLKVITSTPEILGSEAPSRARKEIREGDVLVSIVRPNLNAVALVPPELDGQIASTGFCVLRPDLSVINGKYLFYFTTTKDFVGILTSKVRGAHYPAVSDGDVKELDLSLPALSEQRRIVEILEQADALRKKRAHADEKAACILPALFYKMFGDPATNPKGWPTGPLSELANLQGGFAFKRNDFTQNGALLIRIGNLVNGTVRYDKKSAFLPKYFLEEFEKYVLLQGDLLVALTGATTGKLARYCCDLPALLNQRVGRFIPLEGKRETLDYLDFLMQTDYAQNYIWQYARGFGQPNIAPRQIEPMAIPIPPEEMISKFSNLAQDILKNTTSQNTASSKIDNVFDVLLHRAFSGDLTARWRETHMKELLQEMKDQAKVLKEGNTIKPTRGRRRKAVK